MSPAGSRSDRRSTDRRRLLPAPADGESWFEGLGANDSSPLDAAAESRRGEVPLKQPPWPYDPLTASRASPVDGSGHSAFERIYRAFIAARAALGLALALALVVTGVFGSGTVIVVAAISVFYAVLAIGMWLLPRYRVAAAPRALARLGSPQWLATIGTDVACFLALHAVGPASSLNYVALLVLPVLMAGVLTPRMVALATAAVVTIGLLLTAWLSVLAGGDSTASMTQAGLAGTGFFTITVVAGELAGRLARVELTARGSLEMARQQAQLNRLVIEEMQDGVLVVDRDGRVRTANPAALRLLAPKGIGPPAPFQLRGITAWDGLIKTVERAFLEASWPQAGRDVTLVFESGHARVLRARVRFTRKREREPEASEDLCVLFLEDVRNMQARSRQEKLAAMGRVSAGIAHEIRNPLAAIAQANALLSEDATDPQQRQLMRMVTDNVERLKRIVDDVMEIAPGAVQEVGLIDATAQVAAVCSEWTKAHGAAVSGPTSQARGAAVSALSSQAHEAAILGEAALLQVDLPPEPLGVSFDAEHLRRVLVNLLDNARRHSSGAPGAIRVRLESRREGQAFLSVASDGPPIAPDVEPYLFEPFFSTRSRGTGLGLYICRELCERYGATIDYRLRAEGDAQRNEFFVDMRGKKALGPAAGARLRVAS